MQTKEEHLQAAEKLDNYASKLNDGPYKAKVLGFAEKHRRQSTRKGSLFGKALGFTLSLAVFLSGVFVAFFAVGQTDPLAWVFIYFGLFLVVVGSSMILGWLNARQCIGNI